MLCVRFVLFSKGLFFFSFWASRTFLFLGTRPHHPAAIKKLTPALYFTFEKKTPHFHPLIRRAWFAMLCRDRCDATGTLFAFRPVCVKCVDLPHRPCDMSSVIVSSVFFDLQDARGDQRSHVRRSGNKQIATPGFRPQGL